MPDHVKPGELLEQPKGQSAAKEDDEIFKWNHLQSSTTIES